MSGQLDQDAFAPAEGAGGPQIDKFFSVSVFVLMVGSRLLSAYSPGAIRDSDLQWLFLLVTIPIAGLICFGIYRSKIWAFILLMVGNLLSTARSMPTNSTPVFRKEYHPQVSAAQAAVLVVSLAIVVFAGLRLAGKFGPRPS